MKIHNNNHLFIFLGVTTLCFKFYYVFFKFYALIFIHIWINCKMKKKLNECSSAYIFQKLILCVIKIMRKILAMSSVSLNHLYSVIWFLYTDKRKLWLDFVCMYYRRKLIRQRKNRIVNIDTLQRVSIHSLAVAFKPVYYLDWCICLYVSR